VDDASRARSASYDSFMKASNEVESNLVQLQQVETRPSATTNYKQQRVGARWQGIERALRVSEDRITRHQLAFDQIKAASVTEAPTPSIVECAEDDDMSSLYAGERRVPLLRDRLIVVADCPTLRPVRP
jgi:hypothetical protein